MFPMHPDPTAPPGPSSRVRTRVGRESDQDLAELVAGNRRFLAGSPAIGEQRPLAAVLGCADAQVPVETVFDQGIGRVSAIRTAGQVLDKAALAALELAVTAVGVRLVVVLGHRHCLAVAAAIDARRTGQRPTGAISFVTDEIGRSITGPDDPVDMVARRHVARTVDRLRAILVGGRSDRDRVRVAGALYDVDSGWVHLL